MCFEPKENLAKHSVSFTFAVAAVRANSIVSDVPLYDFCALAKCLLAFVHGFTRR